MTSKDRDFIWRVVDHAVEKAGSHANLFSNRLDFFEESGRIKFRWPVWMHAIKGYLIFQYGEKKAEALLLTILREVMSEANYHAYLRKIERLEKDSNQKAG
ncbi:hypothetical protein ACUR5C_03780 [Aliikangiella sp. IMCC44653]